MWEYLLSYFRKKLPYQPLYYGSWTHRPYHSCNRSGHLIYSADGTRMKSYPHDFYKDADPLVDYVAKNAWEWLPETRFAEDQIEGRAIIHRFRDFCVLAFWDRSDDARCNSYSVFVLPPHTKDCIWTARQLFPSVFQRFKFEVKA